MSIFNLFKKATPTERELRWYRSVSTSGLLLESAAGQDGEFLEAQGLGGLSARCWMMV